MARYRLHSSLWKSGTKEVEAESFDVRDVGGEAFYQFWGSDAGSTFLALAIAASQVAYVERLADSK